MRTHEASRLKGTIVITRQEGTMVGALHDVLLAPETCHLVAISVTHEILGGEQFVPAGEVEFLGRDAVLIRSEGSLVDDRTDLPDPGVRIQTLLLGKPVVTDDGRELGRIYDLALKGSRHLVGAVYLDEERELPVIPAELSIEPEQVRVPPRYADRVTVAGAPADFWFGSGASPAPH